MEIRTAEKGMTPLWGQDNHLCVQCEICKNVDDALGDLQRLCPHLSRLSAQRPALNELLLKTQRKKAASQSMINFAIHPYACVDY